jgi:two-component system response regulator CpxR
MVDGDRKRSVLVVEDDNDVRNTLGEFLQDEGYEVETATNGKEALDQLGKHKPGLVLLDLMMPIMSGWEFLEKRNESKELSQVPVLVLSAVPGKPYVPGALACLKKPIDLQRLMDFVELYCA